MAHPLSALTRSMNSSYIPRLRAASFRTGLPIPSTYGASMPAAAWVAPSPGPRESTTVTDTPRDTSSYATAQPTTPAPITTTSENAIDVLSSHADQLPPGKDTPPERDSERWSQHVETPLFVGIFEEWKWVRALL